MIKIFKSDSGEWVLSFEDTKNNVRDWAWISLRLSSETAWKKACAMRNNFQMDRYIYEHKQEFIDLFTKTKIKEML